MFGTLQTHISDNQPYIDTNVPSNLRYV